MLSVFGGSRTVAGSTHSQRGSTSQQIPAVDHPNGNDRHNIQDHDHPRQLLSAEKSSRPHFLWNLFCWKIGCKEMSYVWHQSYSKERSPVFLHIYPLLSALFQAPPASVTGHGWHLQLLGAAFGTIHEVPFASAVARTGNPGMGHLRQRHGTLLFQAASEHRMK